MKRLLAALARFFARRARRPDVLQLHLIDDEERMFQLAQRTFEPPENTPGDKLAWMSVMQTRSQIKGARWEIYRPGDRGFIRVKEGGDFGPTFLVEQR